MTHTTEEWDEYHAIVLNAERERAAAEASAANAGKKPGSAAAMGAFALAS